MTGTKGTKRKADASNTNGKEEKKRARKKVDDGKIKAANSAYIYFTLDHRVRVEAEYAAAHGGAKVEFSAMGRLMADAWRALPETERAKYEAKAAEDKKRYQAEIAANPHLKPVRRSNKDNMTAKKLFKAHYKSLHKESKAADQDAQWKLQTDEQKEEWEEKASGLRKQKALTAELAKLNEKVKGFLPADSKAVAMETKSTDQKGSAPAEKAPKAKREKKPKGEAAGANARTVFYRDWDAKHPRPANSKKDAAIAEAYKAYSAQRKKAWTDLPADEKKKFKDAAAKEKSEKMDTKAASTAMDTK